MDKGYAESMAHDIFQMIQSAQNDGLPLDKGFHNQPFSSSMLSITYLFLPKENLIQAPMPADVKQRLQKSNVMAAVDINGKKAGIHLICALPKPFADVTSEEEVLRAINMPGLANYKEQLSTAMKSELDNATSAADENVEN